jgi:hypothetical protein
VAQWNGVDFGGTREDFDAAVVDARQVLALRAG